MAQRIIAAAPDQSLRPLTQALVGALELALEEIALLRGHANGPWVDDLEKLLVDQATGFSVSGVDANALQVAQSAIRASVNNLRGRLK